MGELNCMLNDPSVCRPTLPNCRMQQRILSALSEFNAAHTCPSLSASDHGTHHVPLIPHLRGLDVGISLMFRSGGSSAHTPHKATIVAEASSGCLSCFRNDSYVCPECMQEKGDYRSGDVTDDENQPSGNETDENLSERLKLCKKHRNSEATSSAMATAKQSLGRWRYASTIRSELATEVSSAGVNLWDLWIRKPVANGSQQPWSENNARHSRFRPSRVSWKGRRPAAWSIFSAQLASKIPM